MTIIYSYSTHKRTRAQTHNHLRVLRIVYRVREFNSYDFIESFFFVFASSRCCLFNAQKHLREQSKINVCYSRKFRDTHKTNKLIKIPNSGRRRVEKMSVFS